MRWMRKDSVRCGALAVAKAHTKSRAGSVVAAGKSRRWVIVPIAIESEIPIKLSPQLNVVRRVQIEVYSAGLRNGRKEIGSNS